MRRMTRSEGPRSGAQARLPPFLWRRTTEGRVVKAAGGPERTGGYQPPIGLRPVGPNGALLEWTSPQTGRGTLGEPKGVKAAMYRSRWDARLGCLPS